MALLIIKADPKAMHEALGAIEQAAPISIRLKARLIAEEALSNIIIHGYSQTSGTIELQYTCEDNGLWFCLIDTAVAFNQALRPTYFDPTHNGLHIIHGLASTLAYTRKNDKNILQITTRCS